MSVRLHDLGGSMQQGEVPSRPNTLSAPQSSGITTSTDSVKENQHIQLVFTCHQSANPNLPFQRFTLPRR